MFCPDLCGNTEVLRRWCGWHRLRDQVQDVFSKVPHFVPWDPGRVDVEPIPTRGLHGVYFIFVTYDLEKTTHHTVWCELSGPTIAQVMNTHASGERISHVKEASNPGQAASKYTTAVYMRWRENYHLKPWCRSAATHSYLCYSTRIQASFLLNEHPLSSSKIPATLHI